jgi:hypothetical protein
MSNSLSFAARAQDGLKKMRSRRLADLGRIEEKVAKDTKDGRAKGLVKI